MPKAPNKGLDEEKKEALRREQELRVQKARDKAQRIRDNRDRKQEGANPDVTDHLMAVGQRMKAKTDRAAAEHREKFDEMSKNMAVMEHAMHGTSHSRFRSKKERAACFFICGLLLIYTTVTQIIYADGELAVTAGSIAFTFYHLSSMLLTGLFGIVPAMISYVLVFTTEWFVQQQIAYSEAIILLSDIIIYWYVRSGRMRRPLQTLASFAFLSILIGPFWNTLLIFLEGRGIADFSIMSLGTYYITALPECLIAVAVMYAFLNLAPDVIKRLTFMGTYYSSDYSNDFAARKNSHISRQITVLIILEGLVLGVTAALFANALIPEISDNISTEAEEGFLQDFIDDNRPAYEVQPNDDGTVTVTTEDSEYTMPSAQQFINGDFTEDDITAMTEHAEQHAERQARFVMNNKGVAFDLKLILLIMSVAIPFTVIADFYAQQRIGVPITLMAKKIGEFCEADQVEKEEKLAEVQQLPIKNNDEIGDLYNSISTMADNITSFVDQVVREQKLQEDLRVAQKSSEAKSNFLNNMSHEIRTPINAVLGLDEMILREAKDKEILGYAYDIQNAGKTLLGLVNDILDSSKLEAGKMEILPVEYDLSSTINDLVNMLSIKAKDKGLDLIVKVDEQTPHLLYGDEIRIKQVITNILTNAVKYTEKGSVTLNVGFEKISEESIKLKVSVVDTGIGIKEEDLAKLFSPFERIEEVRNRTIEGTGLGMSIVKQLLALMDTRLVVHSVYGEGSDFSFEVEQGVVRWGAIGNFTEMYERTKASIAEYRESFRAPDAHILIVDDTKLNLTVAVGLLKQTAIQIDTAESGFETLDKIKEKHYDAIFLDHRMPEMDGIETLAAIKKLSPEENMSYGVPVIALTANAISGAREVYMEAGFVDYLSKPIDGAKFERMLEEYLPPELVLHEGDEGYAEAAADGGSGGSAGGASGASGGSGNASVGMGGAQDSADGAAPSPLRVMLDGSTMIDMDAAVAACGSEEIFEAALRDYLAAVPSKSADIERFAGDKDYKNYTVLVHALKSSSRLIGATALSEHAAALEAAGDAAQEGDEAAIGRIAAETPDLLKVYRSYFDKIGSLLNGDGDGDDVRPEISADELREAMGAIREFAEAFDFDSADDIIEMLRDYRMPEAHSDAVELVRRRVAEVDQAALIEALDAIESDLV